MAEYTPNLNLLKKDPAVDGNDTFNIKTMLNDNWDKIDAFAKSVEEGLGNVDDVELAVSNLINQVGNLEEVDTETKLSLVAAINEVYRKFNEHQAEIATQIALKANKTQENWITATLQNGWTGNLQYAKSDLGYVTVQGIITAGTTTVNTIVASLPFGYRPQYLKHCFLLTSSSPTSKDGLYVHSSGNVYVTGSGELVTGVSYHINYIYYAG